MTKLLPGVSQSELDAFIARYGVPPLISGGSGEEGDGGGGEGDNNDGDGGEGGDQDLATKALAAERRRAEVAERKLKDANKRLQDIDDRDKTELQKANERAEKAEKDLADVSAQIRNLAAKEAIQSAATEAGGKRPAAIFELVKGKIEFNDKGEITNAKDVIAQAKKDVPELFGVSNNGNPGAGAGGSEKTGADMNAAIRQGAGRGTN